MTAAGRGALAAAGTAAAAALLVSGCGGISGLGVSLAGSSPSPASSVVSVPQLRDMAGLLTRGVQAQSRQLADDAGDSAATSADAARFSAAVDDWANRLGHLRAPSSLQRTKDQLLAGLDQVRQGLVEYSMGLPGNDSLQLWRGESDIQGGVATVVAAAARIH